MTDPLAARVHALIAQWREQQTVEMRWINHPDYEPVFIHPSEVRMTYGRCADALEAALAAALAPTSEQETHFDAWAADIVAGMAHKADSLIALEIVAALQSAYRLAAAAPNFAWIDDVLLELRQREEYSPAAIREAIETHCPAAALAPHRIDEAPVCHAHGTMVADDESGRSWHCAACAYVIVPGALAPQPEKE